MSLWTLDLPCWYKEIIFFHDKCCKHVSCTINLWKRGTQPPNWRCHALAKYKRKSFGILLQEGLSVEDWLTEVAEQIPNRFHSKWIRGRPWNKTRCEEVAWCPKEAHQCSNALSRQLAIRIWQVWFMVWGTRSTSFCCPLRSGFPALPPALCISSCMASIPEWTVRLCSR